MNLFGRPTKLLFHSWPKVIRLKSAKPLIEIYSNEFEKRAILDSIIGCHNKWFYVRYTFRLFINIKHLKRCFMCWCSLPSLIDLRIAPEY